MEEPQTLEKKRLADLKSYQILDTLSEKELDDLTVIASAICDTPISLITFLDENRQWFKAKNGLKVNETSRNASFCQYSLNNPNEILVINDSLKDDRFKDNPLVTGDPKIRFYAGAPLKTPKGNVLGSLCVIDKKPREISEKQKSALMLLAQRVMDFLNNRKILIQQEHALDNKTKSQIKLTNNIPGGIFQLRMSPAGELRFLFLSEGMKQIHPTTDLDEWKKDPTVGYDLIHPEDLPEFIQSLQNSYDNLSLWYNEYRVLGENGYKWHVVKAKPEKNDNGSVDWYGSFQDISKYIEYEEVMKQISFDISHVLRKPVTNLLGLIDLMTTDNKLNKESIKEYSANIDKVAKELEDFTLKLNDIYSKKKEKVTDYYKNTYGRS